MNRQIESDNKVDTGKENWVDELENVHWVIRTPPSKWILEGKKNSDIVNEFEVVAPTEIVVVIHKVKYFKETMNIEKIRKHDLIDEQNVFLEYYSLIT